MALHKGDFRLSAAKIGSSRVARWGHCAAGRTGGRARGGERSRHVPEICGAALAAGQMGQRTPFNRGATHDHRRPGHPRGQGVSFASPRSAWTIFCATRGTSRLPWSRPKSATRPPPMPSSKLGLNSPTRPTGPRSLRLTTSQARKRGSPPTLPGRLVAALPDRG